MMLAPPISTPRLSLCTLQAADAGAAYLAGMNDAGLQRFMESRFQVHTEESLRAFIDQCNRAAGTYLLGIRLTGNGEHIGNIKLGPIDPHHLRASLGIIVWQRALWGQGYASEAIAHLSSHALTKLGVRKLTAGCYADNVGSIRAFARAGFQPDATLHRHAILDGEPTDIEVLARYA